MFYHFQNEFGDNNLQGDPFQYLKFLKYDQIIHHLRENLLLSRLKYLIHPHSIGLQFQSYFLPIFCYC